jgi:DVNP family
MKRPVRHEDGTYHIDGKKFKELFGSREQVMNGTAYKTEGLLKKKDLIKNKWGRIVSLKKHRTAKKEKRLEKAGYFAQKGKFGFVKRETRKTRKNKSRKNK